MYLTHYNIPIAFLILISFIIITPIHLSRVQEKIYTYLDDRYFCFTRLNADHQIGCSTPDGGTYGIAKMVRDEYSGEDIDYIISKGDSPPYVAIITTQLFNLTTLKTFKKHQTRVSGIVVLDIKRPKGYSSDRSCPNEHFSLYANDENYKFCSRQQWNKPTPDHIDGIMFEHWPFPIFLLQRKVDIDMIINKTKEHMNWPKLAIHLKSPMSAAVNSLTCIRRSLQESLSFRSVEKVSFCEPLGGTNIYDHMIDVESNKKLEENSVIMLAARLDSFSMFDGLSPGSDSVISSLITVLSADELLHRKDVKEKMMANKNKALFISLFDGEAFDYIGSSQAAYQMYNDKFPFPSSKDNDFKLNLKHLSHFIELNQVSPHSTSNNEPLNLYLHKHLSSNIEELVQLFKTQNEGLNDLIINEISDPMPLPPSSVQSFLKLRNDSNFKVVVVTNHEKEYINKYYNSFYENDIIFEKKNVINKLTSLSTLISRVLFKIVAGRPLDPKIKANETLIEMFYDCFLINSDCPFFRMLRNNNESNDNQISPPLPTYVSVFDTDGRSNDLLKKYIRASINYLTGEKLSFNRSFCDEVSKADKNHTYLWQNNECVKSNVYSFHSISPAFDPSSFEINQTMVNNKEYAVWTESKWTESKLRMYLVSSPMHQFLVFASGLAILLISLLIVHHLVHNYEDYFVMDEDTPEDVPGVENRNQECVPEAPQAEVRDAPEPSLDDAIENVIVKETDCSIGLSETVSSSGSEYFTVTNTERSS